jgi:hypothetical protein
MNESLALRRQRLIIGLCVPAYIPFVIYGGLTLLHKLSWSVDPPGPLGTLVAALFFITMFVSGWSCAFAPMLSLAALILFLRDPWRSQRVPGERGRLLVWIIGSGVAWCAAFAFFAQMINS